MASTIFDLALEEVAQARPLLEGGSPASLAQAGGGRLTAKALERLREEGLGLEHQEEEPGLGPSGLTVQPSEFGATCRACGLAFPSVEEQRSHFHGDCHRYNVKRRVAGLPPVSEDQFVALDDTDVGSLSGSESESSEEGGDSGPGAAGRSAGPQLQFCLPDGQRCAIWRCLVSPDTSSSSGSAEPPLSDAACLQQLQRLSAAAINRWAVVLLRGGHFAVAVFDISAKRFAAEAIAHKSFHRYVVRAGQGGKQSSKDASGKYARSAGSRLRRHNEAALERDIQEVLHSWHELLDGCTLILVHAPGSNAQTLFGGEAPALDKSDARVRRIPFTTRRPTYSETKRVVRMLVALHRLEPAVDAVGAAAASVLQQPMAPSRDADPAAEAAVEAAAPQQAFKRRQQQQQQQHAAAADGGLEATLPAPVAQESASSSSKKKAEKRAQQQARQKEARSAESAASKAAASAAADDEISRMAARAAVLARQQPPTPVAPLPTKAGPPTAGRGKASNAAVPPTRLSAKPRANEDAVAKRARAAAAAEARMKALQAAAQQQQLY